MAGRAYTLPTPKPDVQPKHAGANNVGYAEGFRPPARYSKSNATATWRDATDSVTDQLHCNLQTRVSLAATLDDAAARDLQVNPYTPGRRPAPRAIVSCQPSPESLNRPSGAYPRDLALTPATKIPKNADGGPYSGPDGKTTGLAPLPKAPPPVPKAAPILITVPELVLPPIDANLTAQLLLNQNSPRVPGTLQAINFHLTEDIAGGSVASEIRVFGPVSAPFIIRQIWINADSGVTAGQFLDVLIAGDGDVTDTFNPSGESIFPLLDGLGAIPDPDGQRGVAIPASLLDLKMAFRVDLTDRWIKVQTLRVAPALALPNVHVTITIERMDNPDMIVPTIIPRAPLLAPAGETRPPASLITSAGESPAVPGAQPYVTTPQSLPAWRVAALGLPPQTSAGVMGTYPALDAFTAWQLAPYSAQAKPFADRIQTVLKNAGVTGGNFSTIIPTSAAIAP